MPENTVSNWTPPVNFRFLVEFQSKFDQFRTSFTEVSGLEINFNVKEKPNDTGIWIKMPGEVTYGNITLKRPAELLKNDMFSQWVNKCLKADQGRRTIPYNMIIKLLDAEGEPLTAWQCACAYPIKWTLGTLDSEKSKLAIETIVMTCNRIERTL